MSVHLTIENYNCPNCNALYIPYKEDLPCPSCEIIPTKVPEENFKSINNIIGNLQINIKRGGSYSSSVLYIGSFLDHVNFLTSNLLDKLEKANREDGEVFINEYFDSLIYTEDTIYQKDFIKSMVLEVYARRDEFPKGIEEEVKIVEETKAPSLWSRLISKFK